MSKIMILENHEIKKQIKYYIEYLIQDKFGNLETKVLEINHNNPLKVYIEKNIVAFKFFEKDIFYYENKEYISNPKNYSNGFYIGKRYTIDDIRSKKTLLLSFICDTNLLLEYMEYYGDRSICVTENGFVPMEEDDITMEEYIEKIKGNNNYKVKSLKLLGKII